MVFVERTLKPDAFDSLFSLFSAGLRHSGAVGVDHHAR
jgi:hypothetical protein